MALLRDDKDELKRLRLEQHNVSIVYNREIDPQRREHLYEDMCIIQERIDVLEARNKE